MAEIESFWSWVCSRRAHDNPRGDLIRDTRCLVGAGVDPSTRLISACSEAAMNVIAFAGSTTAPCGRCGVRFAATGRAARATV